MIATALRSAKSVARRPWRLTPSGSLVAPTYVVFDAPGGASDTATLRWQAPATPPDHYRITSQPAGLTMVVAGDQTSATINAADLTDDQRYTFVVASADAVGGVALADPSNEGAFYIYPDASRRAFSYWDANSTGPEAAGYTPVLWDPSSLPLTMTDGNNGLPGDRYTTTGTATVTGKIIKGTFTFKHNWTFTGCRIYSTALYSAVVSGTWSTQNLVDCEIIGDTSGQTIRTRTVTDVSATAGTKTFTSASMALTSADTLLYLSIAGAGTSGGNYHGQITSQAGTSGTVNNTIGTTVSGATAIIGLSNPVVGFSGGPYNLTRCDVSRWGDVARPSNTGTGDTGWTWSKFYVHDFFDGKLDDGTVIDTPHNDWFQSFGTTAGPSGTVGQDNTFSQFVVDCRYPLDAVPGTYGLQPGAPVQPGGAANNANVDSAIFWGTMLGDTVQNNIFTEGFVEGGGYTIAASQNNNKVFNARFKYMRIGLYSLYDPPVRMDPAPYSRYPSGGVYGTVEYDTTNVWDRSGTRKKILDNTVATWTFQDGQTVVQGQPATPVVA